MKHASFRQLRAWSIITILLIAGTSIYTWRLVPPDVAVLYRIDAAGNPISYHSKFMLVVVMPILLAITIGLQAISTKIEPRRFNMQASKKAIGRNWATLLLFSIFAQIIVLLMALEVHFDLVRWLGFAIGLVVAVLGNHMGKMRSNWLFGIPTPWTLESDHAWDKTHRIGGKLLTLWGLGCIILFAFYALPPLTFVFAQLISILAIFLFLIAYSYFVWKQDTTYTAS